MMLNKHEKIFYPCPFLIWHNGETLFQCVIVEDGARSGEGRHDWPRVLKRPRPRDRDKLPLHSGLVDLELALSIYPMYSTGFIFNFEFRAMIGWWLHTPLVRQQTTQFVGSLCACNNKGDFKKVLKFSGLFRYSKRVIKTVTGSLFHLGNFRKEFWEPTK